MMRFLTARLLQALLVLFVMSLLVFVSVYAIGNPVDMLIAAEATQDEREAMIARLGLDQPLALQYLTFLKGLLSGDVGRSFAHDVPAVSLITARFPATFELALVALFTSGLIGLPLGLVAAVRPRSLAARLALGFSAIGFSVPTFGKAILLILVFAVGLG